MKLSEDKCKAILQRNNAPVNASTIAAVQDAFKLGKNSEVIHIVHKKKEGASNEQ
jgi:hypothetical protein